MTRPWLETYPGRYEVHTGMNDIKVCCGANESIEIVKEYGPLCADDIRVRLEYTDNPPVADWVVERMVCADDHDPLPKWEEMARFCCDRSSEKT